MGWKQPPILPLVWHQSWMKLWFWWLFNKCDDDNDNDENVDDDMWSSAALTVTL